jgi:hypothetical protein
LRALTSGTPRRSLRKFAGGVRRLSNKQLLELTMVRDEDLLAEALAELTQLYEMYLDLHTKSQTAVHTADVREPLRRQCF